jgi:ADP-ribosyl-[dinitrogen reductase] hydrolase
VNVSELERALAVALEAAAEARCLLLAECRRPGGPRGERGHCPADTEAEYLIRGRLLSEFPGWGYLGEETGRAAAAAGESHVWIVDPNDGTAAMQRGYRGHAVSIAVVRQGEPVLGVVHAVDAPDDAGDVIAWAEGCGPLRRNGSVVPHRDWPTSLSSEHIVLVSQGANRQPVGHLECTAPARFIGLASIAYRLALAAAGDGIAAVSSRGCSAWDYAAGHALLRAVGGVLIDESGTEVRYTASGDGSATRMVVGGAPAIAAKLLDRPWHAVGRNGFGEAAPPPDLAPVRLQPDRLVHDIGMLRRAQGCLLGQIAGDALGALVEFESAAEIAASYPNGGPQELAAGGPHRIAAGQPTDDSELALVVARMLVAHGQFEPERVAAAYAAWANGWSHAAEPEACGHRWCFPFDIGGTTRQALESVTAADVRQGAAAQRTMHSASRTSQANGALMRVSPIGIWGAPRDPADVAAAARADASLTHPHPVCQDASALFAVTIAAAIHDGLDHERTYARALEWGKAAQLESGVLETVAAARQQPPGDYETQQGWVLIALQNAFYQLLHAQSVEEAVVRTVRSGGDTDTNAAICAALLGSVHGRDAIPAQWQRMVLSCRALVDLPSIQRPRPAQYWPTDALQLAEALLATGGGG